MKLSKIDIAKALGMVYIGIQHRYIEIEDFHYDFHVFAIDDKIIEIDLSYKTLEKCWEEAADKLLEQLVELLKERL
jgi:hypothetical protein